MTIDLSKFSSFFEIFVGINFSGLTIISFFETEIMIQLEDQFADRRNEIELLKIEFGEQEKFRNNQVNENMSRTSILDRLFFLGLSFAFKCDKKNTITFKKLKRSITIAEYSQKRNTALKNVNDAVKLKKIKKKCRNKNKMDLQIVSIPNKLSRSEYYEGRFLQKKFFPSFLFSGLFCLTMLLVSGFCCLPQEDKFFHPFLYLFIGSSIVYLVFLDDLRSIISRYSWFVGMNLLFIIFVYVFSITLSMSDSVQMYFKEPNILELVLVVLILLFSFWGILSFIFFCSKFLLNFFVIYIASQVKMWLNVRRMKSKFVNV